MQRTVNGAEKGAKKFCVSRIGNVIYADGVAIKKGGILSTTYCPSQTGALGQKITSK